MPQNLLRPEDFAGIGGEQDTTQAPSYFSPEDFSFPDEEKKEQPPSYRPLLTPADFNVADEDPESRLKPISTPYPSFWGRLGKRFGQSFLPFGLPEYFNLDQMAPAEHPSEYVAEAIGGIAGFGLWFLPQGMLVGGVKVGAGLINAAKLAGGADRVRRTAKVTQLLAAADKARKAKSPAGVLKNIEAAKEMGIGVKPSDLLGAHGKLLSKPWYLNRVANVMANNGPRAARAFDAGVRNLINFNIYGHAHIPIGSSIEDRLKTTAMSSIEGMAFAAAGLPSTLGAGKYWRATEPVSLMAIGAGAIPEIMKRTGTGPGADMSIEERWIHGLSLVAVHYANIGFSKILVKQKMEKGLRDASGGELSELEISEILKDKRILDTAFEVTKETREVGEQKRFISRTRQGKPSENVVVDLHTPVPRVVRDKTTGDVMKHQMVFQIVDSPKTQDVGRVITLSENTKQQAIKSFYSKYEKRMLTKAELKAAAAEMPSRPTAGQTKQLNIAKEKVESITDVLQRYRWFETELSGEPAKDVVNVMRDPNFTPPPSEILAPFGKEVATPSELRHLELLEASKKLGGLNIDTLMEGGIIMRPSRPIREKINQTEDMKIHDLKPGTLIRIPNWLGPKKGFDRNLDLGWWESRLGPANSAGIAEVVGTVKNLEKSAGGRKILEQVVQAPWNKKFWDYEKAATGEWTPSLDPLTIIASVKHKGKTYRLPFLKHVRTPEGKSSTPRNPAGAPTIDAAKAERITYKGKEYGAQSDIARLIERMQHEVSKYAGEVTSVKKLHAVTGQGRKAKFYDTYNSVIAEVNRYPEYRNKLFTDGVLDKADIKAMRDKGAEFPESLLDVKIPRKFLEEFFVGRSKDFMPGLVTTKSSPVSKLRSVMDMYELSPETGEFVIKRLPKVSGQPWSYAPERYWDPKTGTFHYESKRITYQIDKETGQPVEVEVPLEKLGDRYTPEQFEAKGGILRTPIGRADAEIINMMEATAAGKELNIHERVMGYVLPQEILEMRAYARVKGSRARMREAEERLAEEMQLLDQMVKFEVEPIPTLKEATTEESWVGIGVKGMEIRKQKETVPWGDTVFSTHPEAVPGPRFKLRYYSSTPEADMNATKKEHTSGLFLKPQDPAGKEIPLLFGTKAEAEAWGQKNWVDDSALRFRSGLWSQKISQWSTVKYKKWDAARGRAKSLDAKTFGRKQEGINNATFLKRQLFPGSMGSTKGMTYRQLLEYNELLTDRNERWAYGAELRINPPVGPMETAFEGVKKISEGTKSLLMRETLPFNTHLALINTTETVSLSKRLTNMALRRQEIASSGIILKDTLQKTMGMSKAEMKKITPLIDEKFTPVLDPEMSKYNVADIKSLVRDTYDTFFTYLAITKSKTKVAKGGNDIGYKSEPMFEVLDADGKAIELGVKEAVYGPEGKQTAVRWTARPTSIDPTTGGQGRAFINMKKTIKKLIAGEISEVHDSNGLKRQVAEVKHHYEDKYITHSTTKEFMDALHTKSNFKEHIANMIRKTDPEFDPNKNPDMRGLTDAEIMEKAHQKAANMTMWIGEGGIYGQPYTRVADLPILFAFERIETPAGRDWNVIRIKDVTTKDVKTGETRAIRRNDIVTDINGEAKKVESVLHTYESDFLKILGEYSQKTAHYAAASEQFPMKIDSGEFIAKYTSPIAEKTGSQNLADWIGEGVKLQVNGEMGGPIAKGLTGVAKIQAAIGLSSPFSGLGKNWPLGTASNHTLFGHNRMFHAYGMLLSKGGGKIWHDITKAIGGTEAGVHELLVTKHAKWWPGLMYPTEIMNRINAVVGGSIAFNGAVKTVLKQPRARHEKLTMAEAKHLIDNVFKLDTNKIIKRGGYTEKEKIKAMQMAHLVTQGGPEMPFMPPRMGKQIAKPLTLFYRIAYRVSEHAIQNVIRPAVVDGNMMPMMRYATAMSAVGAELFGLYYLTMGREERNRFKSMPAQWWAMFIRGEGLAILSNAFDEYGTLVDVYKPAIFRTFKSLGQNIAWVAKGAKTVLQATHDYFKDVVVLYNHTFQIWERIARPMRRRVYESRKRQRQFYKANYHDKAYEGDVSYETEHSPYYRGVREVFFTDEQEDKARIYYSSLNYIAHNFEKMKKTSGITKKQARNLAVAELEKTLTSMRPIPASWRKRAKGTRYSRYQKYVEALKDIDPALVKEELELDKEYMKYNRDFQKAIRNTEYKKLYNIY